MKLDARPACPLLNNRRGSLELPSHRVRKASNSACSSWDVLNRAKRWDRYIGMTRLVVVGGGECSCGRTNRASQCDVTSKSADRRGNDPGLRVEVAELRALRDHEAAPDSVPPRDSTPPRFRLGQNPRSMKLDARPMRSPLLERFRCPGHRCRPRGSLASFRRIASASDRVGRWQSDGTGDIGMTRRRASIGPAREWGIRRRRASPAPSDDQVARFPVVQSGPSALTGRPVRFRSCAAGARLLSAGKIRNPQDWSESRRSRLRRCAYRSVHSTFRAIVTAISARRQADAGNA